MFEQTDVRKGTEMIRGATRFSACLPQQFEIPGAQKDANMEETIELQPIANTLVSSLVVEP